MINLIESIKDRLPWGASLSLGLKGPDKMDLRDRPHAMKSADRIEPIDLRKLYKTNIRDQGRTNACGGYTGAAGLEMLALKTESKTNGMFLWKHSSFSANEVYWNARNDTRRDDGVFMRDLMKALHKKGSYDAAHWKDNRSVYSRPKDLSVSRFFAPEYERIGFHSRVPDVSAEKIKSALSVEKLPLFIGAMMFEKDSINASRFGGVFKKPNTHSDRQVGGHAMLVVGWTVMDNEEVHLIIQNSWGTNSGDKGIFYAPLIYWIENNILLDVWTVSPEMF